MEVGREVEVFGCHHPPLPPFMEGCAPASGHFWQGSCVAPQSPSHQCFRCSLPLSLFPQRPPRPPPAPGSPTSSFHLGAFLASFSPKLPPRFVATIPTGAIHSHGIGAHAGLICLAFCLKNVLISGDSREGGMWAP